MASLPMHVAIAVQNATVRAPGPFTGEIVGNYALEALLRPVSLAGITDRSIWQDDAAPPPGCRSRSAAVQGLGAALTGADHAGDHHRHH
jgi:hypothetical protein